MTRRILLSSLCAVFVLSGCLGSDDDGDAGGDGGDGGNGESGLPNAYFFDAPVYGLAFDGGGISDITEASGQFPFDPGLPVTFSLAGLELGSVTVDEPGSIVTPPDLRNVNRSDFASDTATVNMLRLFLTMDLRPNDTSRVVVPDRYTLESNGLGDELAGLSIGDPNFESQIASHLESIAEVYPIRTELVGEAEAISHFDETLAQLAAPPPSLIGEWGIRTEGFGEFGARLTLNGDNTGEYVEYRDCSGSGETAWVANEARAQALCGTIDTYAITWDFSSGVLTMDTGDFIDTCKILVGNDHQFTGGCEIASGSGTEAEVQYFIRSGIDGFSEALIPGDYVEFSTGTHTTGEASFITYTGDNRGEYTTGTESGNFDWLISADNQTLELTVDGETTSESLSFQRYMIGALEYFSDESGEVFVAIPGYRGWPGNVLNAHRYDMTSGTLIGSGEDLLESPNDTDHGEVFTEDDKVCRQIHQIQTLEGNAVRWMNCSNFDGSGAHTYELWRDT